MNDEMKARFKPVVSQIEGYKNHAYHDIYGNITVGIGHNLTAQPVADDIITRWFNEDSEYFYEMLMNSFEWFEHLAEGAQMGLVYMAFNMGWARFLTFTRMLRSLEDGDMEGAAQEILNSRYYRQVPRGAGAVYNALQRGVFEV